MNPFVFPWRLLRLATLLLALAVAAAAEARTTSKKALKAHNGASLQTDACEFANFGKWQEVAGFIRHMVREHSFNQTELESIMRKTCYSESAIQLMQPAPPERPKNWRAYRARFVEPVRITSGAAFWEEYAGALERAETRYGVPAEIIVGIIGVETIYGRNTGNFRVMDAVTTLAFAYPETPTRQTRMEYFRRELEHTLLYARESGVDPFSLRGSYAGAIGLPQFMPGSIRRYAVDFDGDGKIDLRNSPVDAIGSIANFLVRHGWRRDQPIVFPASIGPSEDNAGGNGWQSFIGQGLEAKFTLDELRAAGVVPGIEPPPETMLGLVDLQNGLEPTEYWLGAANFFALTRYNRSFFYAMSVLDLGRAVRTARCRLSQIP